MHQLIGSLKPKVTAESTREGRSTPNPHEPQRERESCQNTASILYVFTTPKVLLHLLNVGKNKEIMTGHFSPIRLAGESDHRSLDAGRQSFLRSVRVGQPENHTSMLIQRLMHSKHRNKQKESGRGQNRRDRGTCQKDVKKKKPSITKHLRCRYDSEGLHTEQETKRQR